MEFPPKVRRAFYLRQLPRQLRCSAREIFCGIHFESYEDVAECNPVKPQQSPSVRGALAVAVAVATWWLRRRGCWLGALGVGFLAGARAALAPQLAAGSLPLLHSAEELLTLHRAVAAVAGEALASPL